MTAMLWQLQNRDQSLQTLLREFRHGEVAEFAGNLTRIEKKTQVRWRNARRNLRILFTNVVGNQPVMFFCAEHVEVVPGPESRFTEQPSIAIGHFFSRRARWTVQPQ